jgi:hypothetical protein
LNLFFSDASSGQIDLAGVSANVTLSDASHVYFTGKINNLDADVSGSSVLNGFNAAIATAQITASGSSEVDVNVTQALTVTGRDASKILYKGSPSIAQHLSDASMVQKN